MKTLDFGHRGASFHAPENTLSAFRLAREMGVDGIELDVQLSRDGIPIVMHDATVDRTTEGTGAVADLSLGELRELDAGSWFSSDFAGEGVPTLAEVFEAVGQDMTLNLELKVMSAERTGLEEKVTDCIASYGTEDQVLISSFNPLALERVRQTHPHLRLALLYGPSTPQAKREHWVQRLHPLSAVHPEYHLVDETHLQWARSHDCRINTWTVDQPKELQRLIALEVDGIITNRPDLLATMLRIDG